jgi:hypothetical protein
MFELFNLEVIMENYELNRRAGLKQMNFVNRAQIGETHELNSQNICVTEDCLCPDSKTTFMAKHYKVVNDADLLWALGKGPSPFAKGGLYNQYKQIIAIILKPNNSYDSQIWLDKYNLMSV